MAQEVNLRLLPITMNPQLDCGSDVYYCFKVKGADKSPVDFSGYTAKMQMRPYPQAKKLYDELSTDNGRIVLDESKIILQFPAETTQGYKFDRCSYDVVVTSPGGLKYRVVQGEITFRGEVTR